MTEFIAAILAFPTVVFTGLLGLAILYWLFVIVGALDVHLLDPGAAADGVADGAIKGAAEGLKAAADGALKGAGELAGSLKGAAEGGLKGAAEDAVSVLKGGKLADANEAAGLLGALRLKDVPVTVTGSLLLLWSWAFSYLGMQFLGGLLGAVVPLWLVGLVVMVGAVVVAYPVAALSARPFAGLFATEVAKGRDALVGQIVAVTTLRVDGGFGQAAFEDGQGGLLVPVRCPKPNALQRGDEALIVSYDPERETFTVEPLDPALAGDDASRARAMARVAREKQVGS